MALPSSSSSSFPTVVLLLLRILFILTALLTGAEKDPGSRGCHGYGAIEKGAVPGGAADGASLDLEDVPRSLVIKRVLTILAFVAMFMLGLTVRLTTQGLTEVGQQLGGANISTTHV